MMSVYVPKKNEVHANPLLLLEGARIVVPFLISAGFFFASREDLANVCNEIYTSYAPGIRLRLDNLAASIGGTNVSMVDVTAEDVNNIMDGIRNKFGTTPDPTYTQSPLGTVVSSPLLFSSVTVPINLVNAGTIFTYSGKSVNLTVQWGKMSIQQLSGAGNSDPMTLIITCPDGYKYKLMALGYSGTLYAANHYTITPALYNSASGTPDLRIYDHSTGGALGESWYMYGGPGGYTKQVWNTSTSAWNDFTGNIYNDMLTHLGAGAIGKTTINANTYNNVVNKTYTEPVRANVPTNMDTAMTITRENSVVYPQSATIIDGLPTTAKPDILDSIQTWISGLWDWIVSIPTLLKGLWDYLGNVLERIYSAVVSFPITIGNAITNVLFPPISVALNFTPLQIAGATVATRFPFSIPFDLVNSFSAFNVAPVAPKWKVDFPSTYFTGGGTFDIDFAMFDSWAVIIRWGELLTFSVGLILISRKMIGGQ